MKTGKQNEEWGMVKKLFQDLETNPQNLVGRFIKRERGVRMVSDMHISTGLVLVTSI